ncbi:MAG TPA: hypothetical protein VE573_02065 [Nitrososphaeraceae archaeon]|jgi:hypothetical protein|nr:hypothetical protein [Nitrososphaeraceae archaeon]
MIASDSNNDIGQGNRRVSNSDSNRIPNEQDEKKVKDLNREIMMIFQMYKASYGHTSAALLSVLSYLSDNYLMQHPENKQILYEYFEKEFKKFLNMIEKHQR